jgi:hypothetical protein
VSGPPARDPDAPEIRAWGRENGWEVEDKGRVPAALRSAWATANAGGASQLRAAVSAPPSGNGHASNGSAGPVTFEIPDYVPPDVGAAPAYEDKPEPADERAPEQPPKRSRREQLAERFRRPERERPRGRRRVTLETLGGLVWAGAAQLCARYGDGRFLPVANVMAFQAPVAGLVAEDVLKHTVADAVLQPVARLVESGSTAGALIGPPVLVGMVCARPELYPVARPLLAVAMKEWIIAAGPKLRELRRREEKFAAEMGEMGEEFDGFDIEAMIDQVFAPMFAQQQQAPAAPGAAEG